MSQIKISETETVIKKILPYLKRRDYDIDTDMTFEQPTADDGISKGYIDILVSVDKKKCFVIEAKKISKQLRKAERLAQQHINNGEEIIEQTKHLMYEADSTRI